MSNRFISYLSPPSQNSNSEEFSITGYNSNSCPSQNCKKKSFFTLDKTSNNKLFKNVNVVEQKEFDFLYEDDYLYWKYSLGRGKFSEVYMKFDRKNKKFVALKCVKDEQNEFMLSKEDKILRYIQDNIQKKFPNHFFEYHGIYIYLEFDYPNSFYSEQLDKLIENLINPSDKNEIFFNSFRINLIKKTSHKKIQVMKMENGLINFSDLLSTKKRLNFSEILYFLKYLTDTLEILQTYNVAHGNIEPENIVLVRTSKGEIVPYLCGFSKAAFTSEEKQNLLDYKKDVYSLGDILLEMINLYFGKENIEKSETFDLISKDKEFNQLIEILKNMLKENPEERYDFIELKEKLDKFSGAPPQDLFFLIELSLLKQMQLKFKQVEGAEDELEKLNMFLKESYMYYCVNMWYCRNEMLEISYMLTILCGKKLIERSKGCSFPIDVKYLFELLNSFYPAISSGYFINSNPGIWQFTVAELGSYEIYEKMFSWSEFSLEMKEKELKEKLHNQKSIFIQSMGIYFGRINQYGKALACFELIEEEEIINKVHVLTTKGCIYYKDGQLEQAINCFEKGLSFMKFIKDQNHLDLCILYRNLMALYSKSKNLCEFQKNWGNIFEILKNIFGKSHFTILLTLMNFFCIKELKKNEKKRDFQIFIPKLKCLLKSSS